MYYRSTEQVVMLCMIALVCVVIFPHVACHTMQDARRLLADKQMDYHKSFRPITNQSAPIVLYVTLELVSIQEFNEVQETLTTTAVLDLSWIDEYMKWNPDNYGGMEQLVIESDKVWTPNLVLTNNVDKLKKIGDAWQVIRFSSDGTAFYYPGDVFSASCKVDVTYYPWDRHRCGFNFAVWAHSANEVLFLPSADKVQTSYFSENGAWTFFNSSVEHTYDTAYIEFYLHLERKPRFVLVNVILPIVFMAFLNAMIFVIPVECGERISYSITVLLAIAVFLTLVGDNLPKTSNPMSIFSYYLLIILVLSICITLATIFNVRLYYADDSNPVIGCLASVVKCMKCNCRRGYRTKQKYQKNSTNCKQSINDYINTSQPGEIYKIRPRNTVPSQYEGSVIAGKNMFLPARNKNQYLIDRNLRTKDNKEDEIDYRRPNQQETSSVASDVTWKDVSTAFDKIFFALSIVTLITATTALFLVLLLSDRR